MPANQLQLQTATPQTLNCQKFQTRASMPIGIGPMLSTVPLEGTQRVTGLLELERRASRAAPQLASTTAVQVHVSRYRGPHWWELTLDELKFPPHFWQLYFGWSSPTDSYNVPCGLDHLKQRLDENVAYYVNNHTRVAGVALLLVLYTSPKAFVGSGLLIAIGLVNLHIEQTAARPISEQLQTLQGCSAILAVAAAVWGGTIVALFRWSLYTTVWLILHGSFHVAASEDANSGVPIGSALDPRTSHQDPRRVFRETWDITSSWCEYAARLATSWTRKQAQALQQWTRQTLGMPLQRRRPHEEHLYMH